MVTLIRYRRLRQGLAEVGASSGMRRLMAVTVGDTYGRIAQSYARQSSAIRTEPTLNRKRWAVRIIHDADDALSQEYGGRGQTRRAPLGRTLDAVRANDPNRRSR